MCSCISLATSNPCAPSTARIASRCRLAHAGLTTASVRDALANVIGLEKCWKERQEVCQETTVQRSCFIPKNITKARTEPRYHIRRRRDRILAAVSKAASGFPQMRQAAWLDARGPGRAVTPCWNPSKERRLNQDHIDQALGGASEQN